MSCFDTIKTSCPQCNHTLEFQSKGGDCNNRFYRPIAVPADVADGAKGKSTNCPGCGVKVYIVIPPMPKVSVSFTVDDPYKEDDEDESNERD